MPNRAAEIQQHPQHVHEVAAAHNSPEPLTHDHEAPRREREEPHMLTSQPQAADQHSHDRIALRAYQFWQERGAPDGSPEEDWYRAEQEFHNGHI